MDSDTSDRDSRPGFAHVPEDPSGIGRYRQIFEAVALPVLMIDHESWRIVAVNEAAVRQYGYTREEFVGLPVLHVRPPEGRAEASQVLSEMPHGSWRASTVSHQRKDGSIFSVDVWSRDTVVDGQAVRISTISDVSELVQLQHELQRAQKMEAVGRLAGGIAHEFNNVLTSIIGNVELLMEEVGGGSAAELVEIRRAAGRAAFLTSQLLAFSRQQVMRVEVVPLNWVVGRTESLLRHALAADITLETHLEEATWPVRVDPGQLEQVIMHLAVNAQDAMPNGGVLTVAADNVSLEKDRAAGDLTVPVGDYAELTVRDTGVGMDELTRARVFEPFFTTKPPPRGTGLGLSTVYGIIRQSDGFITVDSAPGAGTTFRVLLPRADVSESPALPAPAFPGASDERTVLVVEDADDVRRVICRVLERLGFKVLSAADGEEAFAMMEPGAPSLDLLITDLIMPRVGGRDLAAHLATLYPELSVLFVSGYTDEPAGHFGVLGRGRGLLQTPFSVESLLEAVREVLTDP